MRYMLNTFASVKDQMSRRRGSVLILAVVLVVLLALMGTALLSTARIDRYRVQQISSSVNIDLIAKGVAQAVNTTVVKDLYNTATNELRPGDDNATSTFDNWDASDNSTPILNGNVAANAFARQNDKWLSPRTPLELNEGASYTPAVFSSSTNLPFWLSIGAPPQDVSNFDSPFVLSSGALGSGSGPLSLGTGVGTAILSGTVSTTYNERLTGKYDTSPSNAGVPFNIVFTPDYINVVKDTSGNVVQTFSTPVPAWSFQDATSGKWYKYVAADADGDGIADSGLYRLPIATDVDGLTFFAGVRVIDNNAAVNVNTAMSNTTDYVYKSSSELDPVATPDQFTRFFRSSVGLAEMLKTFDPAKVGTGGGSAASLSVNTTLQSSNQPELRDSLWYRSNGGPFGGGALNGFAPEGMKDTTGKVTNAPVWVDDPYWVPPSPPAVAVTNALFGFNTLGEAMESHLARRLGYPGFSHYTATTPRYFQPFSTADQLSLGWHFELVDPTLSPSQLEALLPQTLYRNAANSLNIDPSSTTQNPVYGKKAYGADQGIYWYNQNFAFGTEDPTNAATVNNTFLPKRALLTTINGVSNQINGHDLNNGIFNVLDSLRKIPPFTSQATLNADTDIKMINYSGDSSNTPPTYLPTTAAKASVNTANFGELWRAYWNVMVDGNVLNGSPCDIRQSPASYEQVYNQSNFLSSSPWTPAASNLTNNNNYEMFRSSIRDPRTPDFGAYLAPRQEIMLRSAIAAVNTMDQRNSPNVGTGANTNIVANPTVKQIALTMNTSASDDTKTVGVLANVAGGQPQPFITEVFVDTANSDPSNSAYINNPNGFIAVEIYNPYDFPIDLTNWTIAVLDRPTSLPNYDNGLNHYYIPKTAGGTPWTFQQADNLTGTNNCSIASHAFMVLTNYKSDGSGDAKAVPALLATPPPPTSPATPDFATLAQNITNPKAVVYVPNLQWVIKGEGPSGSNSGGEMVLLRPIDNSGSANAYASLETNNLSAVTNVPNAVPVDSFDFTGMASPSDLTEDPGPPAKQVFQMMHYVRSNCSATAGVLDATKPNWQFVYPGRYNGAVDLKRQQGTELVSYVPGSTVIPVPTTTDVKIDLGGPDNPYLQDTGTGPQGAYCGGLFHTIQWCNRDAAGPSHTQPTGVLPSYPFGGFGRNGDIMQVPFIGSYIITGTGSDPKPIMEVNSVTADAAMAEDGYMQDDESVSLTPGGSTKDNPNTDSAKAQPVSSPVYEQVGRFVPIHYTDTTTTPLDDLDNAGSYNPATASATTPQWSYHWATRLFDYLTVQAPNEDYSPNTPGPLTAAWSYYNGNALTTLSSKKSVRNSAGFQAANSGTLSALRSEDTVPVQGLININTAPWRVLAALPWGTSTLTTSAGTYTPKVYSFDSTTGKFSSASTGGDAASMWKTNAAIAKAIVAWRDGLINPTDLTTPIIAPHGPFKSVFDLYRVQDATKTGSVIKQVQDDILFDHEPDDADGEFSPYNGSNPVPTNKTDGVRNDFEEQYLMLNRVSNLISTRSDSFTVYIVVQGWKINQVQPWLSTLSVQKRISYILDRSPITLTNQSPGITSLSNE